MNKLNYIRGVGIPLGICLSVLSLVIVFQFAYNNGQWNPWVTVLGIVFFCFGVYLLDKYINQHKWFVKNGIKTPAKIISITKIVVRIVKFWWSNDQVLFKINVQSENPISKQSNYNFISSALYNQPSGIKAGDTLDVYVDPKNADNYWVDISKIQITPVKMENIVESPGHYSSFDGVAYRKIE